MEAEPQRNNLHGTPRGVVRWVPGYQPQQACSGLACHESHGLPIL